MKETSKEVVILGGINITSFLKAFAAFKEAISSVNNDLERDGAIQRFEFTYELAWKTIKRVLNFKGIDVQNPRDVFREAAKQKLLADPVIWFEFIRKINLTTHTYNQESAEEIFKSLPDFEKEVSKLIDVLIKL